MQIILSFKHTSFSSGSCLRVAMTTSVAAVAPKVVGEVADGAGKYLFWAVPLHQPVEVHSNLLVAQSFPWGLPQQHLPLLQQQRHGDEEEEGVAEAEFLGRGNPLQLVTACRQ